MAIGFRQGLLGSPFQSSQFQSPLQQMTARVPQMEEKKPSFFGEGGAGRDIAGYIGDALMQMSGMRPIYAPMQQDRREFAMRQQLEQQKRQADWEDWQKQEQWKRANPMPVNNDTVNDYNFILQKQGQGAADNYLRNLNDPMVTVQLPGNRVYSGPRSGMAQALGGGQGESSGPKPGDVEEGYQFQGGNPADPNAWKKVGGGASNGTGSFRQ